MNTVRIKRFFLQSPIWQSWVVIVLLLCVGVALIYFRIPSTDRLLILHYTIPYGIDLVGPWWKLYEIPIAGFVIASVNFTLSYLLFIRQRTIAIALILMTVVIEFIFISGLLLLINQNIR